MTAVVAPIVIVVLAAMSLSGLFLNARWLLQSYRSSVRKWLRTHAERMLAHLQKDERARYADR